MNNRRVDVLISGAGPAGLCAAWEALKAGKKTAVVCNRSEDFVRIQSCILDDPQRNYLRGMYPGLAYYFEAADPEDQKFFLALDTDFMISIKDIERFVKRRLDALAKNGAEIEFCYNAQLEDIDLNKGLAYIQPVGSPLIREPVFFHDLVCADGTGRHALQAIINKAETGIRIMPVESKVHPYHVSAYLLLQRYDHKELELPELDLMIPVKDNCMVMIGLNKKSHLKSDKKAVKCSIAGELPGELFNADEESRKTRILNYMLCSIVTALNENRIQITTQDLDISLIHKSRKHGGIKDKLKFMLFKMDMRKLNVAAAQTCNDHRVIAMGDNVQDPNYQIGQGLQNALKHAMAIGRLFRHKLTVDDYNDRCARLSLRTIKESSYLAANKQGAARVMEQTALQEIRMRRPKHLIIGETTGFKGKSPSF